MDLKELKSLREKADELSKYDLVSFVKKWDGCIKSPIISCTQQFKTDISISVFLKNINKGQNADLFVAEYKSLCDHYISILER